MENSDSILLFKKLLLAVSETYQESNSPSSTNMEDWKGTDILNFQDELRSKNGSSVSEKWFYTYVKKTPNKLPRIDILNLLSNYAGFKDWTDFMNSQKEDKTKSDYLKINEKFGINTSQQKQPKHILSKKRRELISIVTVLIGIISLSYYLVNLEPQYTVCIVDTYDNKPLENSVVSVTVLKSEQSPLFLKTDKSSSVHFTSDKERLTFIISSPYHKTDTITRLAKENEVIYIPIQTNDYALMLDYYANKNIEQWKKRRYKLDKLIANDAIIMELLPYEIGINIYDKKDFIDKITTPTSSLEKMEIIETVHDNNKLSKIKFRIKS